MSGDGQLQDGLIEIKCPFCGALLVRDYDFSDTDEDLLDELLSNDLTTIKLDFDCPHVASYEAGDCANVPENLPKA